MALEVNDGEEKDIWLESVNKFGEEETDLIVSAL
jgi:hypothetical protein